MKIEKMLDHSVLNLKIEGRLDTLTAPILEQEITNLDGITELIMDLQNVEYISSAGLRVILKAYKMMKEKGIFKLKNVNDCIREILEITGFANFLIIE